MTLAKLGDWHLPRLRAALLAYKPDIKQAFFGGHTPSQTCECFWFYLAEDHLVMIEMPRSLDQEPIAERAESPSDLLRGKKSKELPYYRAMRELFRESQ